MKIGKQIFFIVLILSLVSCSGSAKKNAISHYKPQFDLSKIEKFKSSKLKSLIINDYDSVFNSNQRKELSDYLYDYDIKTTRQIVVVTVDKIDPYSDVQKLATDLGNYWGVGTEEKNNGITIVLCKPQRKIGIATGLGTELVLTDEICKNVIDRIMIPEFKNGNYYNGIKQGVAELIDKWH